MRFLYGLIAALFLAFAAAQLNDPDPAAWVLLYSGTAVFYILFIFGMVFRPVLYIWVGISAIWALSLLPELYNWIVIGAPSIVSSMKAEEPWIEFTREFFGLSLNILAILFLLRQSRRYSLRKQD